ncbi:MAG: hypothetical protein PVI41_01895, partial [Roseobacter sp.]
RKAGGGGRTHVGQRLAPYQSGHLNSSDGRVDVRFLSEKTNYFPFELPLRKSVQWKLYRAALGCLAIGLALLATKDQRFGFESYKERCSFAISEIDRFNDENQIWLEHHLGVQFLEAVGIEIWFATFLVKLCQFPVPIRILGADKIDDLVSNESIQTLKGGIVALPGEVNALKTLGLLGSLIRRNLQRTNGRPTKPLAFSVKSIRFSGYRIVELIRAPRIDMVHQITFIGGQQLPPQKQSGGKNHDKN